MDGKRSRFAPFSFGETSKMVELDGLILTDTSHLSSQRLPRHRHELANVLFVLNGSFSETVDGRNEHCDRHSLFIRPPEERHSNEYDSAGARCLIIGIKPKWRESISPLSNVLERPRCLRGGTVAALGLRIYKELRLMDGASALSIEGLLLEICAQAMRHSISGTERRPPAWLEESRELIHAHFADHLTLGGIAKEIGVHPVHLARSFRQHHKCTVGEYVRNLRIEFARRELATSDTPLVEIAMAAGFCAQSHFSTGFKRHTGLTPAEYRAMIHSRK